MEEIDLPSAIRRIGVLLEVEIVKSEEGSHDITACKTINELVKGITGFTALQKFANDASGTSAKELKHALEEFNKLSDYSEGDS